MRICDSRAIGELSAGAAGRGEEKESAPPEYTHSRTRERGRRRIRTRRSEWDDQSRGERIGSRSWYCYTSVRTCTRCRAPAESQYRIVPFTGGPCVAALVRGRQLVQIPPAIASTHCLHLRPRVWVHSAEEEAPSRPAFFVARIRTPIGAPARWPPKPAERLPLGERPRRSRLIFRITVIFVALPMRNWGLRAPRRDFAQKRRVAAPVIPCHQRNCEAMKNLVYSPRKSLQTTPFESASKSREAFLYYCITMVF